MQSGLKHFSGFGIKSHSLIPLKLDVWRKTISLLIITIAFFFLSNNLFAQVEFSRKILTVENGLPHHWVTTINQDQTGFLWIGTWDGLSRFDGYEFKNYFHRPEDSTSFAFFSVEKILVDRNNQVLIDCDQRPLSVFNRGSDNFRIQDIKGITDYSSVDFCQDYGGCIWAIDLEFLYQLDDSLQIDKKFRMVDEHYEKFIFSSNPSIVLDNTNTPWLFFRGMNEFFPYRGRWVNDSVVKWLPVHPIGTSINKFVPSQNHEPHFGVYTTKSGHIYLFSNISLFIFDTAVNEFRESSSPPHPDEFSGPPAFFWSNEETGLNFIDTRKKKHFTIGQNADTFHEMAFMDASGVIWSGTTSDRLQQNGLTRHVRSHKHFNHYLTERSAEAKEVQVFPVLKDKFGNIWAGIREKGKINRIKPDGSVEKVDFSAGYSGKDPLLARALAEDESGLWIGCASSCLFHYDFISGSSRVLIEEPPVLNGKVTLMQIHNIIAQKDYLIINGHDGIFKYRKNDGKISLVFKLRHPGTCHSMIADGQDGFWLGIWDNTVIHLDGNFRELKSYKLGTERNLAEHVCLGDHNDVWVALMGGGLGHLYPQSGKNKFFTTADGLSNNVLYSILKDSKGNLWITTNQGISMFNPKSNFFRRYGKEDGLLIEEFNSDSWFQSNTGEILFGGVGGLVSFYPDSLRIGEEFLNTIPLVITKFKVSGRQICFSADINDLDTVTLAKGDNNFQVTFALLDFIKSSNIKYRYRLIGENSNWIEIDSQDRNISFGNLTHKDYSLVIEATDQEGNWAHSRALLVRIPHRIVETFWFRLLSAFILVSAIVVMILMYIRQKTIKTKQLQDELRLESLRGQMNPHFIFNSLNSINYFIATNDKISANNFISDFSTLIRSILSNLSANYIPFELEIESLEKYLKLEHLRFGDRFEYSIDTESVENRSEIRITPGMVQPFIENAIWHGLRSLESRVGKISIKFSPTNQNALLCKIMDDGIGRKLSGKFKSDFPGKKSRGIGIVQERIKIINRTHNRHYSLEIEDLYPDREETGTVVSIFIPIETEKL
jgi:ligand-binding sensor domain-containing protein